MTDKKQKFDLVLIQPNGAPRRLTTDEALGLMRQILKAVDGE